MKFIMLGSGGYIRIPRACCNCRVCSEARKKGYPYKRLGQSLFLEDENILFDTPEDINEELNHLQIKTVENIVYSHWHPDHTLGYRIIETLRDGKELSPINVYMPGYDLDISIKNNKVLPFFEIKKYCKLNILEDNINIGKINIKRIPLTNGFASGFIISENSKELFYCPCHAISIPIIDELKNMDCIIMNLGNLNKEEEQLTNFKRDNLRIINQLKPKKTIFTHIEEVENTTYDEFKQIEKNYENIFFGYDGMIINI